jgi:DNA-binding MarR family transcriptional regulator
MSSRPPRPDTDRTPLARLAEGPLHAIVGYQLAQAQIVTDRVFDDKVRDACALRRVEFTILALVQANPDLSARQLARALAVTPPNIALWLDKLDSRGLVARTRSERDARVQHLRLTADGQALLAQSMQRIVDGERAALAGLSAAERAMLVELLHKVALARRRAEP